MTYNVWFEDHFKEQRYHVILKMIKESQPDIVCLQEVTKPFMNILLDQSFIKHSYYISGNIIKGYGNLMLTRFPCNFFEVPFESSMNRSLLLAEPIGGINGKPILFGTVHLESGDRRDMRR